MKRLMRLFKRHHIDICKVLNQFDPNRSTEFRKRNQAYMVKEHKHKNETHASSDGGGCCSV